MAIEIAVALKSRENIDAKIGTLTIPMNQISIVAISD